MKCLRIGARNAAIFMLTLTSILWGSIPAYGQPETVAALVRLMNTGTTVVGSTVTKRNCFPDSLKNWVVLYNRGTVWARPLSTSGEELEVLFIAPPNVDIKSMTKKKNSSDILVEFVDGSFTYGLYDTLQCTWKFINVTKIPESGFSASPEKVVGDALYALSTADVQVSRDTGRTWQEDTTGLGGDVLSDIALDSLQFIYGVSPTQLYKQHPDSSVWRKVESYPSLPASFDLASVFVDRRNRIFVGAGSNGVYSSTDNGNNWAADTAGMGKLQILNFGDDTSGNIYAPQRNWLFRSSGGTQPWVHIDGGLTALTGTGVGINAVGGESSIIAATNFGLFNSTDHGTTWSDRSQGLSADNVTGLLHLSSGKFFAGAPRGIYFRNATDTIWTKAYPQGRYQSGLTLATAGDGNIYTIDGSFTGPLTGYGYPLKSTDEGVSWNLDTAGVSTLLSRGISWTIYYVDESGGQHTSLWPGTSSWFPYKKTPGGSWTPDSSGMNIDLSAYDGQLDLTGDGNGNLYCSNAVTGMFRRAVSGNVWSHDTAGLGSAFINRLCKGKNGDIYASASGGIYYVRRGGTWTKLPSPPGVSIGITSAIAVDGSGAFVIAARGGFPQIGEGVYVTTDDGQNWAKAGLDSMTVTKMVSFGDSTYILTNSRGAYMLTRTGNTAVQNGSATPMKFVLAQNYPNPFNPGTGIRYHLPAGQAGVSGFSDVRLVVYDILGREVAVLVNERKAPGSYEARFDGAKLASGVYFYRLTAGAYVATRKMLLLR